MPSPHPASKIALTQSTPAALSSRTWRWASSGVLGMRTSCGSSAMRTISGRCSRNCVRSPPSTVNMGPQTKICAPSLLPLEISRRSASEPSSPSPTLRAAVTPL